ncbi:MAG: NUDIX domain-containing protein [Calditrichaeota bacterium]|nr:NUDIX domain-containing protein [Calditrichota bacterium]
MKKRVKITKSKLLSDKFYQLRETEFQYLRNDGNWQSMKRISFDRGDGAAVLLYNPVKKTVVLIRQFRFPAYENGYQDQLIEVCAGSLGNETPEECVHREAKEETGYEIFNIKQVMVPFMSPGAVTEKLFLFTAEYNPESKVSDGGGLKTEGEDIEVLEMTLNQAMQLIEEGEIRDAKTIILLQYATLQKIL